VQEVIQNLVKVQQRIEGKYKSTAGNKAFVIIRHSEMPRTISDGCVHERQMDQIAGQTENATFTHHD
jgi:hypothetical protein